MLCVRPGSRGVKDSAACPRTVRSPPPAADWRLGARGHGWEIASYQSPCHGTAGQPEACSAEGRGLPPPHKHPSPHLTSAASPHFLLWPRPGRNLIPLKSARPTRMSQTNPSFSHLDLGWEAPLPHISLSDLQSGDHGLGGDGHDWERTVWGAATQSWGLGVCVCGDRHASPRLCRGRENPRPESPPSAAPRDRARVTLRWRSLPNAVLPPRISESSLTRYLAPWNTSQAPTRTGASCL